MALARRTLDLEEDIAMPISTDALPLDEIQLPIYAPQPYTPYTAFPAAPPPQFDMRPTRPQFDYMMTQQPFYGGASQPSFDMSQWGNPTQMYDYSNSSSGSFNLSGLLGSRGLGGLWGFIQQRTDIWSMLAKLRMGGLMGNSSGGMVYNYSPLNAIIRTPDSGYYDYSYIQQTSSGRIPPEIQPPPPPPPPITEDNEFNQPQDSPDEFSELLALLNE